MALVHQRGWDGRPIIFFTDHAEDLPLIRLSRSVCWFGDAAMLQQIREQAPGVLVIDCGGYDAGSMNALLGLLGFAPGEVQRAIVPS